MDLLQIASDRREAARAALQAVLGPTAPSLISPVFGGASGALAYRVEAQDRAYLLRLETAGDATLRNPHQYVCMQTAAEAGVAPRVHFVDPAKGVALMDFVSQHPLSAFPGGPSALAAAMGQLLARLQGGQAFPALYTYSEAIRRLLAYIAASGRFAPNLLDRHAEGFERIDRAYPWAVSAGVASHNDPNPRNILFDGQRLWLIDWETSYLNDPMTDVAIVTHETAPTEALADILLRAWLGRDPDPDIRARLALMKPLTRLYYGVMLLSLSGGTDPPEDNLSAFTGEAFGAAVASGQIVLGTPAMLLALGKMMLAGFVDDLGSSALANAVKHFE